MGTQTVEVPTCYFYNSLDLKGLAKELVDNLLSHKSNYFGFTLHHFKEAMKNEVIALYMIDEPDFEVCFATRVNEIETGVKELIILGVVGSGVFKNGARLLALWKDIAVHMKCQFIWTQTSLPGVARVLRRFKFMPISEAYVYAIEHGRRV